MKVVDRPHGAADDVRRQTVPAPMLPHVAGDEIVTIDRGLAAGSVMPAQSAGFVFASWVLQDIADYRAMLRGWFAMLRIGGRLAIEVPHAFLCERELALPSRSHPARKRLYTPSSLLGEIEEALEPNSYRVRLLCDHDAGYDYAADEPVGEQSVLLVLERIEMPSFGLDNGEVAPAPPPAFAFEPARTRREIVALAPRRRVAILKLDHLGDFIMGVPALEKARETFADAELTLIVGTWNEAMARDLGIADIVIGFDAFPRNSSEETVDLAARVADFTRRFPAHYDLAIDLRTDPDTRFFLRHLRADVRAGIGTRSQFDFLDIFLPIDGSRHGVEAASDEKIGHRQHSFTPECRRSDYRIVYAPAEDDEDDMIGRYLVFGPYVSLGPGDYLYEPHIEIDGDDRQLLLLDVACDMDQVTYALASTSAIPQLRFRVEEPDTRVEFRIGAIDGHRVPGFSFYGGRLHRRGASSVLHQSEYLALLIDLIAMRTDAFGLLREDVSGDVSGDARRA